MIKYLRRNHVALLALFIALGGTSYAATQLPANSVGTRQIRASSVTEAKLTKSLRGLLVPRRSATVLPGPRGTTGATGATGPAGSAGPAGASGPAGAVTSARAYGFHIGCLPGGPCPGQPACPPGCPAVNATFEAANANAPAGTVCIRPGPGISAATPVVVSAADF